MPPNVRGYHEIDITKGGRRKIYIKENDTLSGTENTILHEFREVMDIFLYDVYPAYKPLLDPHLAANQFATAVLLPRQDFTEKVYATGLDVIALSQIYKKSCSQVLLRMGEVLQGQLCFYASLFEPDIDNRDTWKVNYWTRSQNGVHPDDNICGVESLFPVLFPRKGNPVSPGSLVDMSIKNRKSYIAQNISLSEEEIGFRLVAIARPLIIAGSVEKVVWIVLLSRDKDLLEPQIQRIKPVELNRHF